jgi:chemotaxis protein MotB
MDTTLAKLQAVISKDKLEDKVKVRSDERGIVVSVVTDKFLFDKGQASIRPQFDYVLDDISTPLRAVPNQIRVEGYTDDLPICTAQFPSNWELSTMRATVVLRYFLNHKELPEDRMSVAGYADTRPVVPNDSEEDRAHNRRVEIVVLKSSEVAEEEPTDTASPGSE